MKCLPNKTDVSGIADNNNLYRCSKGSMWRKELFVALLISIALILTVVIVLFFTTQKEKMNQAVISSLNTITTDSSDMKKNSFDTGKTP
jgi:Tfp pilus assembly protein PilW